MSQADELVEAVKKARVAAEAAQAVWLAAQTLCDEADRKRHEAYTNQRNAEYALLTYAGATEFVYR